MVHVPFTANYATDASEVPGGTGIVLLKSASRLHALSLRDGATVWSCKPVAAHVCFQPDSDESDEEDEEDGEDAESTAHLSTYCLDASRGLVWGVFGRAILPISLADGQFVGGTVKEQTADDPHLNKDLSDLSAEELLFNDAPKQFATQRCNAALVQDVAIPQVLSGGSKSKRVKGAFIPECESKVGDIILVPGVTAKDDLIVVSGGTAGLYAVRPTGRPAWCYYPLWGGSSPEQRPEITAARQRRAEEDVDEVYPHQGLQNFQVATVPGGGRYLVGAQDTRSIMCLNPDTGQELWSVEVCKAIDPGNSSRLQAQLKHQKLEESSQELCPFFGALQVLPSHGIVIYMSEVGSFGLWRIATGEHIMSVCSGLMRRAIDFFSLVTLEHAPGTYATEWKSIPLSSRTGGMPCWNSGEVTQRELCATLCLRDSTDQTLMGLELLLPDVQDDDDDDDDSDSDIEINLMSTAWKPDLIYARRDSEGVPYVLCPRWQARGRNSSVHSDSIVGTPEGGLIIGKDKGDIEVWNVTRASARWAKRQTGGDARRAQLVRWDSTPAEYDAAKVEARKQAAQGASTTGNGSIFIHSAAGASSSTAKAAPLAAGAGQGAAAHQRRKNKSEQADLSDFDIYTVMHLPTLRSIISWHGDGFVRRWDECTGQLLAAEQLPGDNASTKHKPVLVHVSKDAPVLVYCMAVKFVACLVAVRAVELDMVFCIPLLPGYEEPPNLSLQTINWDDQAGLSAVLGLKLDAAGTDDAEPGLVDVAAESGHPPEQVQLWGRSVRRSRDEMEKIREVPPRVLLQVAISAQQMRAAVQRRQSLQECGPPRVNAHSTGQQLHGDISASGTAVESIANIPLAASVSTQGTDCSTEEGCEGAGFISHGTSEHIVKRTLMVKAHFWLQDSIVVQQGRVILGVTNSTIFSMHAHEGAVQWSWHIAEDKDAVSLAANCLNCHAFGVSDCELTVQVLRGSDSADVFYAECSLLVKQTQEVDGLAAPKAASGAGDMSDTHFVLMAVDALSRRVLGACCVRKSNTKTFVASNGSVVVVTEAGVGVSLLHPRTLLPMTEHPYEFSGRPQHVRMVFNSGALPGAGELPSHLMVFGADGQLVGMPVGSFLGPLHLSPQIDLSELLLVPEGIMRQIGGIMFYVGLALALVLVLVDFVQMASFAFATATPPSLQGTASTLRQFQALGMLGVSVDFKSVFWGVAGVLVVFFALTGISEHVEEFVFRRKEDSRIGLLWTALTVVVQLMTSVAVIPLTRVLVGVFDCLPNDSGAEVMWNAVAPERVRCFSGEHVPYVVVGSLLLLVYFPLTLRLLMVRNDLSRIELDLAAPWDCSGDDRSAPQRLHVLSKTASIFGVCQAVAKLLAGVIYVLFGARFPGWSAGAVVVLGVLVLCAGVFSPPYHYNMMNRMRTALDAGVLWTYVVAAVAVFVLRSDEGDVATGGVTDLVLSFLPAGILLVIPLVYALQWQRKAPLKTSQSHIGSAVAVSAAADTARSKNRSARNGNGKTHAAGSSAKVHTPDATSATKGHSQSVSVPNFTQNMSAQQKHVDPSQIAVEISAQGTPAEATTHADSANPLASGAMVVSRESMEAAAAGIAQAHPEDIEAGAATRRQVLPCGGEITNNVTLGDLAAVVQLATRPKLRWQYMMQVGPEQDSDTESDTDDDDDSDGGSSEGSDAEEGSAVSAAGGYADDDGDGGSSEGSDAEEGSAVSVHGRGTSCTESAAAESSHVSFRAGQAASAATPSGSRVGRMNVSAAVRVIAVRLGGSGDASSVDMHPRRRARVGKSLGSETSV